MIADYRLWLAVSDHLGLTRVRSPTNGGILAPEMRLYLSSFRMGDHPERLVAMLPEGASAAVIANACDAYPAADRPAGVQREQSALARLAIKADEIDLRAYFGRTERLAADLRAYRLLWVRGGNTFMLRHALAESGADHLITELVRRDGVVYGGYSAGVCVLTPSLRGLEVTDDPDAVHRTYSAAPRWDGLGVLDRYVVPHYRSPGHPETEMSERLADHYEAAGLPHWKLCDGQAIVIDGRREEIV